MSATRLGVNFRRLGMGLLVMLAAVALLIFLYFAPRAFAIYQLYWSQSGIRSLLHDELGFSEAWSSFIAVVFSFFYALAWIPLIGWTVHILGWNFNWKQFGLAFVCWIVAYGHSPLAHAVLGQDICFNQRTGHPLKWYVIRSNGEVQLFDSGGYDPQLGQEKLPVTSEICSIHQNQLRGVTTKRILGNLSDVKLVGSRSETRVWFYETTEGTIELFDSPGFHPKTHALLTPVQASNEREIKERISAALDQQRKKIELWLVRDGQASSKCVANLGSQITTLEYVALAKGHDPALLIQGDGCYCGSITYCRRYVYAKLNNSMQLVLVTGPVSAIEILDSVHNGYRDVRAQTQLAGHLTGAEYQFDGQRFRQKFCLDAPYAYKQVSGREAFGEWKRWQCSGGT